MQDLQIDKDWVINKVVISLQAIIYSGVSSEGWGENPFKIYCTMNDESVDTPEKVGNITIVSGKGGTYRLCLSLLC